MKYSDSDNTPINKSTRIQVHANNDSSGTDTVASLEMLLPSLSLITKENG